MTCNCKVNQVNKAEYPAPAHEQEYYKHHDVHNALRAQHYAQAHEAFNYPAHYGYEQQYYLNEPALRIEPLVESHIFLISLNNSCPLSAGTFFTSLQEEFLEQKHPNAVEPADKQTAYSYHKADYKSDDSALFKECRPSHDDFDYPVDNGYEQKQYLNESALSVEPGHRLSPLILFAGQSRTPRTGAGRLSYPVNIIPHFADKSKCLAQIVVRRLI